MWKTPMDQSYFREQADRCRRLARDSTIAVIQVTLRRLADEYQTIADELEDDEISANGVDPKIGRTNAAPSARRNLLSTGEI
jgi:hypothetical protein